MADYRLIQGDCIESMKALPTNSVQCCVTSPPYYGLRDYGHEGQIGLEETPEAYVAKLVDVFREVRRVLRDDGTLWLNLACSYNGSGGAGGDYSPGGLKEGQPKYPGRNLSNFKPKDMIPIPWMVAMALQADGYYLRSDIIWSKPNPMPESVTDRPTKSHEYIFLLSKSKEYYYDAEAIREPNAGDMPYGDKRNFKMNDDGAQGRHGKSSMFAGGSRQEYIERYYTNGRNKRSVWTVTTKPYAEAHFATYPPDLIEPCILAGTSAHGCCAQCGAPWERDIERVANYEKRQDRGQPNWKPGQVDSSGWRPATITDNGWQPTCGCDAGVVPCTVLDPFNGSGTTGAVALKHGRNYIGCELNPDYIELAHNRIRKSQPMLLEVTP